ncbi:hypothetical protein HK098_006960 [Nowakowskiella sp. JEL0407]|nr:hypothetical protein HK098_006960 [Nowakowskiella sp. JEL0407]
MATQQTQADDSASDEELQIASSGGAFSKSDVYFQMCDFKEQELWVKKMVRLALFNERKKVPLRRQDILKNVLGDNSKPYHAVLKRANDHLQRLFGLEIVEVSVRHRKPAASKRGGKKATTDKSGSNSYILRSTLPPESRPQNISWDGEENARVILLIILSLIHVSSGSTLNEERLKSHLKSLHFSMDTEYPDFMTPRATTGRSISVLMAHWCKVGYLDKVKNADPDVDALDYVWGPRAKIEVSTADLANFIVQVQGVDDQNKQERLRRDIVEMNK